MGDGYKFRVHQYKNLVEHESDKDIILIDGKGQCIFEDNIFALCNYLDGYFDGYSTDEDYLPWNYPLE